VKLELNPDAWTAAYEPRAKAAGTAPAPLTYSDRVAINVVLGALTERADAVAKSLQDGTPATVEAYRDLVGELRGITFAINAVRTAEREASGADAAPPKEQPLYVA
jgi:hypothetical protein